MAFDEIGRLARTLWHVPPHALAWRVWARIKRVFYMSPFYGLAALQGEDTVAPVWVGPDLVPGDAGKGAAMAKGTFAFAGEAFELGIPPRTWTPAKASALWQFTMHYHEWLADMRAAGAREEAQRVVEDWLVRFGHYHPVAWHPYPLSLRVAAWLTHGGWLLEGAPDDTRKAFYEVLHRQAVYLAGNCEYDLGGNHLLKNLKALIYAGFAWDDLRPLREKALATLLREVPKQILPDGGHYERSSLYQAQVVRDLLDIRALLRKAGGNMTPLDAAVRRAGTALAFFRYPDGGLGLWNDADEGRAEEITQLIRLSGAEEPPVMLPESGYARLARGPMLVLMDGGRVGPDENPGHAHADMLAFEMVWHGARVIVNQGTFAYQHRLRNAFRGTSAHSTVSVDGKDSAEVWAAFRVGRRPRNVDLRVQGDAKAGDIVVEGHHDGYRHLGARHRRKLVMAADGSRLRGEDEVNFPRAGKNRVMAHFHLHPDVQVRLLSESEAKLTLGDGKVLTVSVDGGRLDVRDSRYAPQFGVMKAAKQLVIHGRLKGHTCRMDWQIFG